MKNRTPPSTAQEFVARLVELDGSVPLTDEDADVILRESGIDPGRELKRAMVLLEAEEQRQRQARFAKADADRRAALAKLAHPTRQRSRPQLLQRLAELKGMAPREAQPQAYFKNFEAASAEDLERIVADFEHLLGLDSSGEH
jgi:hypothetical protein